MKRILALILLLFPTLALAEIYPPDLLNDAINDMIDSHPYKIGIFRTTPLLAIESGYDSNALSISLDNPRGDIIGDYYVSVAPGGSAGLKLGHRAFFMFDEDLNFLYYKQLSDLRDIYTTTKGQFVTGNRKLLLTLYGDYEKKKMRPSTEFDQPARVKNASAYGLLNYAMRSRTRFNFEYLFNDYKYAPLDPSIPQPLPPDYKKKTFTVGLEELVGQNTSLTTSYSKGENRFADSNLNQRIVTHLWEVDAGFLFNGNKLTGTAKGGYESQESRDVRAEALTNYTVDLDVRWNFRRNFTVGAQADRSRMPSSLSIEGFRLETLAGVYGTLPIHGRYFIDGAFTAGKNDYTNEPLITKDNYQEYDSGLDIELKEDLVLRGGVTYFKRSSDFDPFNKNRFVYSIGLKYAYTKPEETEGE